MKPVRVTFCPNCKAILHDIDECYYCPFCKAYWHISFEFDDLTTPDPKPDDYKAVPPGWVDSKPEYAKSCFGLILIGALIFLMLSCVVLADL